MSRSGSESGEGRRTCVERAIRAISEGYVDAERGRRIADAIARRLAGGEYAAFLEPDSDPAALAARLSADLQSASALPTSPGGGSRSIRGDAQTARGDLHLRLVHRPPLPAGQDRASLRRARMAAENFGIARLEVRPDGIGLLELRYLAPAHLAGAAICSAMSELSESQALILDLRANRGGDPGLIALICTHLFDADTPPRHLNDMHFREGSVQQWWTLPWLPGPRPGSRPPVWVLIGPRTFSGGEELACNLQSLGRARLVGQPTAGAAHPAAAHALGDGFELALPYARSVNPHTGQSWEGRGLSPDLAAPAEEAETVALFSLIPQPLLPQGEKGSSVKHGQ